MRNKNKENDLPVVHLISNHPITVVDENMHLFIYSFGAFVEIQYDLLHIWMGTFVQW